jgi:hypothetical protein
MLSQSYIENLPILMENRLLKPPFRNVAIAIGASGKTQEGDLAFQHLDS